MNRPRTLRLRPVAPALIAACLAAQVLAGCAGHAPPPPPAAPFVQTTVASHGAIQPNEALPGIVAPFQNVAIQSTLTEPADSVNVQEGDPVHRGEVLAQLDTADLRAALDSDLATAASDRANSSHTTYQGGLSIAQGVDSLHSSQTALQQARETLARDRIDLNRYHQLSVNGYVSDQQYRDQLTTVRNDEQAVVAAQSAVSSAESNVTANGTLNAGGLQASSVAQAQAQLQSALAQAQQERVAIAKATIVSPIDGVVVNRNLNVGEYPGTRQLFTLQEVDPVYAVLRGSGAQIAEIVQGTSAAITSSDLRGARMNGTVVGILNQIAPGSTDFQVKVLLRNPGGKLRPGMAIAGNISLPAVSGVRVPVTAFTDDNHTQILSVSPNGTVRTVKVTEIAEDNTSAVVTGVEAGTRVIDDGQTSVGEGQKVAIR